MANRPPCYSATENAVGNSQLKRIKLTSLWAVVKALVDSSSMTGPHNRLASTAAATALLLVRHWSAGIVATPASSLGDTIGRLSIVLQKTCSAQGVASLSVPTAVLTMIVLLLQEVTAQRRNVNQSNGKAGG